MAAVSTNACCEYCPYPVSRVSDEDIYLQISLIFQGETFELVIPSTHSATCADFGVVTHMRGGEGFARKVDSPITELIVKCCDEASLLAVKRLVDVKCLTTSIAIVP